MFIDLLHFKGFSIQLKILKPDPCNQMLEHLLNIIYIVHFALDALQGADPAAVLVITLK